MIGHTTDLSIDRRDLNLNRRFFSKNNFFFSNAVRSNACYVVEQHMCRCIAKRANVQMRFLSPVRKKYLFALRAVSLREGLCVRRRNKAKDYDDGPMLTAI